MNTVGMIAVIYHDVNQKKRFLLVKNAEELNRLNTYYVDDYMKLNCYTLDDLLLLNMKDEALLQFLFRNDENGNIIIPYLCFVKDIHLNSIKDFKEPVDIATPYPLFHEVFILMEEAVKHVFSSQDDFIAFLRKRMLTDNFGLLKAKKVLGASTLR